MLASMVSSELQSRIDAGMRAVLNQTELLHREFGRAASQWKYDGSRVTPVDIAISEGIFNELKKAFPVDQLFSEELADTTEPIAVTSRFCWVLDPIDGTNNYATGIPDCAISLAILENGNPAYGIVYDLARKTLMHGGPGVGMWDGDNATTVKDTPPDRQSLIGFHTPMDRSLLPSVQPVLAEYKIRGLGSSTLHLAYVAAGKLDATIDHNVKIWDIAAAVALCLGAGGEIHTMNGEIFPMKVFNLKMGRIQYYAGSAATCANLRRLLAAG